jgi:RNA polymerase sigma-70 factor (ECF subfamily)
MAPPPDPELLTQLLQEWSRGEKGALDRLIPVVYDQLRKVAGRCLRDEKPGHTLRATALVHEAYLRLVDCEVAWENRVHFYAVAARVLRRILVDHAKASGRQKRGGAAKRVPLNEAILVGPETQAGIVELDEALNRLAQHDSRKGEIIQLLFFGGMTYEETAAAVGISPATVHRELKMAKAWLYRELAQV